MSDLPYASKTVSGDVGELANLIEGVEERPLSALCPGVSVYLGPAAPAPCACLLASCFTVIASSLLASLNVPTLQM